MKSPKHVQKSLVVCLGRIIVELNSLCMVTKVSVSRVLRSSTSVADTGTDNPRGAAVLRLGEPESC